MHSNNCNHLWGDPDLSDNYGNIGLSECKLCGCIGIPKGANVRHFEVDYDYWNLLLAPVIIAQESAKKYKSVEKVR